MLTFGILLTFTKSKGVWKVILIRFISTSFISCSTIISIDFYMIYFNHEHQNIESFLTAFSDEILINSVSTSYR